MANVTILQLPVASSLSGSEYFPLVQGGTDKRAQTSLVLGGGGPQSANTFLAGPTSGAAATVTFRTIVNADLAAGATSNYILTAGASAPVWTNPSALGIDLDIGSTTITGGTTTRVLYDNAGVLGEYTITGSGTVVAMATSPVFTTPTLGVASATTINKVTITAPATGSTLTIADLKTLSVSNTLTFTATDGSSVAFGTGGTVLYTTSTIPLTVGTTTIASGTNGRLLYDNSGVLGEISNGTSGYLLGTNGTTPSWVGFVQPYGDAVTRTWQAKVQEACLSVKDFGAVGDGVTNDTAAIQDCLDAAFGTSASPHATTDATLNRPVYFPPGEYIITAPLTVTLVHGGKIFGAGRFATKITQSTSGESCFETNGFEYSTVDGIYFSTSGADSFAFDLFWDGTTGAALQSNRFSDCFFVGDYGVVIGNGGEMGSENIFINCFFGPCGQYGLSTWNFNALQNSVIGGNFQACLEGIHVESGSVPVVMGTGFQVQTDWDIHVVNQANDSMQVIGCRSESENFIWTQAGMCLTVIGCTQTNSTLGEFASCDSGVCIVDSCQSVAGDVNHSKKSNTIVRNSAFGRATDWCPGNAEPMNGGSMLVENVQYGGTLSESVPSGETYTPVFVQHQYIPDLGTGGSYTSVPDSAANTHQFGNVDAAAPASQTVQAQSVVAGTSNTAGADWILGGSKSTGDAAGGAIQFAVALAGGSGSTQNALTNIFKVNGTGHALWNTDNTYDIGAAGATRPRTGYFGTSVVTAAGSFATVAASTSVTVTSATADSLAVGRLGATTPAFTVDSSTGSQVAGLKVTGAVTGGTVAVVTTDSGADTNLIINAKGTGTIGVGSVSTGRVTITPVTTITGALTLSSTALVYDAKTLTGSTGTGNMVLATTPTLTTPVIGAATGTSLVATGVLTAFNGTAIPAGGTAGSGFTFSATANFGTFFGSGVPTLSAARGSIYLRSDGQPYYNTDGATTWSPIAAGGVPAAITVANEAADTSSFIGFFTAATGDLGPKTNANLTFNSSTGYLGIGPGTVDRRLHVEEDDATNNAVTYVGRLTHTTSGSPATNIGVGVEFEVETSANNNEIGVTVEAVATDATAGSEDFTYRIKTMRAGQAATAALNVSLPGTVYPQGHIFALTMSNAADTANDITIAAGEAVDESGVYLMTLSGALTKQIDAAWAVGTNAGGINTGAVAGDTWYEVILIAREDTGVVDVMFSTTGNRATLPANYTHKRRIGWVRRNAANDSLLQFSQSNDYFTWITQINDAGGTVSESAAPLTLTVPPSCCARFRAVAVSTTSVNEEAVVLFSEIIEGSVTPTAGSGTGSLGLSDQSLTAAGHFELLVSATSTIEIDSDNAVATYDVSTYGYIDWRRRLSAI